MYHFAQQLMQQTYFTPAILLADSYKLAHHDMYPEGMDLLFSTWTPRSDKIAVMAGRQLPLQTNNVTFFGLTMAISKLTREFAAWFARPTEEVVAQYVLFVRLFLKTHTDGQHIRELHELGRLPLLVFALPEGTVTKTGVCQLVIFNTDGAKFAWMTNYVECLLSNLMWKPQTSATIIQNYFSLGLQFADMTCDEIEDGDYNYPHLNWQHHDFAFRGLSCPEDAEHSAVGHLLFSNGTDTIPSLFAAAAMYADFDISAYGSVPASEHSIACTTQAAILHQLTTKGSYDNITLVEWEGQFDPAADGHKNFESLEELAELISIQEELDKHPTGILSWVSDTWDYWAVITKLLPRLKTDIMSRDGKLVIRPDSGDPIKIICGDRDQPFGTPAYWGTIKLLGDIFGTTTNSKGFRVLDPHIGLIYGDSITLERAELIYAGLARNEFASSNVVLGIGSYTYQATTRDVWGFAMKATAVIINGNEIAIFKDPKTDDGIKKSFRGFLTTRYDDVRGYYTVDGLSFAEACDLTNSAFIEYPLSLEGLWGQGLNSWPAIKAKARESLNRKRQKLAA